MKFREHLKEQMNDPEFEKEYKNLGPEYELVRQIIQAREEKRLTQKDLAELTGIPQGHISRIENGMEMDGATLAKILTWLVRPFE
jgi:predicted transcriptional regulator